MENTNFMVARHRVVYGKAEGIRFVFICSVLSPAAASDTFNHSDAPLFSSFSHCTWWIDSIVLLFVVDVSFIVTRTFIIVIAGWHRHRLTVTVATGEKLLKWHSSIKFNQSKFNFLPNTLVFFTPCARTTDESLVLSSFAVRFVLPKCTLRYPRSIGKRLNQNGEMHFDWSTPKTKHTKRGQTSDIARINVAWRNERKPSYHHSESNRKERTGQRTRQMKKKIILRPSDCHASNWPRNMRRCFHGNVVVVHGIETILSGNLVSVEKIAENLWNFMAISCN